MLFEASTAGEKARIEVREHQGRYRVVIEGKELELDLVKIGDHDFSALVDGVSHDLSLAKTAGGFSVVTRGDRFDVEIEEVAKGAVLARAAPAGPLRLVAAMPGKIVKVLVAPGDIIETGRGLLVMEAMKMENELKASRAGTVQEIRVKEGQAVEMGALLAVIG